MSFASLKKNSGKNLENLLEQAKKLNQKSFEPDPNEWQPVLGKDGNGYALIRFLSAPDGEDSPFVRLFRHSFKGEGGWLIENCPTTIGLKCPVCEYNNGLWNSGVKEKVEYVRKVTKRRLIYRSNIYIIKHANKPEDEGKVWKYNYGAKIYEKIEEKMSPKYGEEPIDPFDMWNGLNFQLKIRTVPGDDKKPQRNYDLAQFETNITPLLGGDDDKLKEVYESQFSLTSFIAPDQFKSYDDIKSRLNTVLKLQAASTTVDVDIPSLDPSEGDTLNPSDTDGEDTAADQALFQKLLND